MKSKRNNVGLCLFLLMTRQNLDLGMEKCEINLCEKHMFMLASCCPINIIFCLLMGV